MSTTYPLTPPSTAQTASFRPRHVVVAGANTSPYNLARQVYLWPGERWEADWTLVPLRGADLGAWEGFLMSLDGIVGTFLLGDPNRATPFGAANGAPGTPVVDGAGQVGESLNIRGLPAGTANYLVAGDPVQLGSGATTRLHKVMQTVSSDGSGKATLTVRPRVKTAPADGAPLVVSGARGIWCLSASSVDLGLRDASALAAGIALSLQEPR